ncbi:hypothetical protein ACSTIO_24020, partial [Vibrio parahaemolyticus]
PRLQAEEQLAAIDATGLGGGKFPQEEARSMLRRLHKLAFGWRRQRAQRANRGQLAAIGIGVTIVGPAGERTDG